MRDADEVQHVASVSVLVCDDAHVTASDDPGGWKAVYHGGVEKGPGLGEGVCVAQADTGPIAQVAVQVPIGVRAGHEVVVVVLDLRPYDERAQ